MPSSSVIFATGEQIQIFRPVGLEQQKLECIRSTIDNFPLKYTYFILGTMFAIMTVISTHFHSSLVLPDEQNLSSPSSSSSLQDSQLEPLIDTLDWVKEEMVARSKARIERMGNTSYCPAAELAKPWVDASGASSHLSPNLKCPDLWRKTHHTFVKNGNHDGTAVYTIGITYHSCCQSSLLKKHINTWLSWPLELRKKIFFLIIDSEGSSSSNKECSVENILWNEMQMQMNLKNIHHENETRSFADSPPEKRNRRMEKNVVDEDGDGVSSGSGGFDGEPQFLSKIRSFINIDVYRIGDRYLPLSSYVPAGSINLLMATARTEFVMSIGDQFDLTINADLASYLIDVVLKHQHQTMSFIMTSFDTVGGGDDTNKALSSTYTSRSKGESDKSRGSSGVETMLIPKSLYWHLGGFDEDFNGEQSHPELHFNYRLSRLKNVMVRPSSPLSSSPSSATIKQDIIESVANSRSGSKAVSPLQQSSYDVATGCGGGSGRNAAGIGDGGVRRENGEKKANVDNENADLNQVSTLDNLSQNFEVKNTHDDIYYFKLLLEHKKAGNIPWSGDYLRFTWTKLI